MHKVVAINLNGNAYQLEEPAYGALQKYLAQAEAKLADDPDKAEIVADFEQAVADKCTQCLGPQKTVVTAAEMTAIISAMGPVEQAPGKDHPSEASSETVQPAPKRFYLIEDGGMIGGVCNGLSAYFNVDVSIIRLLFIFMAFITSGAWVLAYFAVMLVAPEAKTPEQKAAARGEQFRAQDVLERAKQKYSVVTDKEHWQSVGAGARPTFSRAGGLVVKLVRILAGIVAVGTAFVAILLSMSWILALWSLMFDRVSLPAQLGSIPDWHVLLGVTALFYTVLFPVLLLELICERIARTRAIGTVNTRWTNSGAALWFAAVATLMILAVANATAIRTYTDTLNDVSSDGSYCLDSSCL